MIEVRRAVPDDAPELVRLRGVMLGGLDGEEPAPGPWQAVAEETLRKRLAEPIRPPRWPRSSSTGRTGRRRWRRVRSA